MRYLTLAELLALHALLLQRSGGMPGVRDNNLLDSSVAPVGNGVGGQDLYPTASDKGAALCFSLVMNHPFFDGNKRIGHAAMETFLLLNGFELSAQIDDQEKVILQLAAGHMKRTDFTDWVRSHTIPHVYP